MVVAGVFAAAGDTGFSRSVTPGLVEHFARLFGQGARGRLEGWRKFVQATPGGAGGGSGDAALLRPVNGFFNRVPSVSDLAHWGAGDYWATPAEFLASNGGDCEDYALAKYYTLKELGVPVGRLRLVYARTWQSTGAHMVLAYYAAPGADPLILDNLAGGIAPAADRPDLIPVFTFNDDDLRMAPSGVPAVPLSANSIRLWRELQGKLSSELKY